MDMIVLPGLIDVHTHLRVPGGEHKEDFASGTAAALAGGVTQLLAMPNTSPPLVDAVTYQSVKDQAIKEVRCDVGLFAGASPEHAEQLPLLGQLAPALKIYLNDTFGPLRVEDVPTLRACFQDWPHEKMIAMHAEKQSVAVGLGLYAAYDRAVHFCHISRREEIELISDAKTKGVKVTCEVSPHHLFLTQGDAAHLGPLGDMRPILGSRDDVDALWEHIGDTIDCIATDHAPHTLAEKKGPNPPPGVPGLETSLSLMLTAVAQDRLSLDRVRELMHENPRRIYRLPAQPDTWIEVDMQPYVIGNEQLFTKVGWSPFAGMEVVGRVQRVYLRGELAYDRDKYMGRRGLGSVL